jgi:hypothetical protein
VANETVNGDFNYELPEGQLSFRREFPMYWIKQDKSFIGLILHDAVSTCDTYFPALMRVLYGGHTPEDAVFLAELEIHSTSIEDDAHAKRKKQMAYFKRCAREGSFLSGLRRVGHTIRLLRARLLGDDGLNPEA